MYPIVTSSGCPEKSFLSNTTLGVSIHETPRPRFRRRPRPHRRSCHNTGFIRYHENPDHRRSNQHAAGPDLRPRRSERLRNCSRPLKSNTSIAYGNAFSKKESFHEIDHSRIRRRPRCHRCSCHNSDFIRLNAESCRCRPDQHVASPHLCPRRSERLRNCPRPLNNDNSIAYLIILPKKGFFHEIDSSRIRLCPRSYRCRGYDPDLIRLNQEPCRCRPDQHAARSDLRPGRSERLRHCPRPLGLPGYTHFGTYS